MIPSYAIPMEVLNMLPCRGRRVQIMFNTMMSQTATECIYPYAPIKQLNPAFLKTANCHLRHYTIISSFKLLENPQQNISAMQHIVPAVITDYYRKTVSKVVDSLSGADKSLLVYRWMEIRTTGN